MAFSARANSQMNSDSDDSGPDRPERLSPTGQMVGWGVFGGLVLVGFFFGIVTGYERPKPTQVAAAPKESQRPEAPKQTPKTEPAVTPPKEDTTPKQDDPKVDPPKVDQPKVDPPKIETPPPPKKEPPKTPVTVSVSFQKDVLPIFRTYCLNCHGGGTGKPRGDVDLRTVAAITDPKNPPILTPGKPEKSAIYTQIVDMAMPPEGKRPGKGETEVIRDWILGGAKPRRPVRGRRFTRPVSPFRLRSRTPRSSGRAS
jgi:hypothetical protein